MSSIDYDERIPNNVGIAGNRRLKRALEAWQPAFLEWWRSRGPDGFMDADIYLRTAVSVEPDGWMNFGHVKMPDYRWGVFLMPRSEDRRIEFGRHKGEPAWQEVPGEYRAPLRRLIVIQGDTEPASVEQQRYLGHTCPSLFDLRSLFQVNVEEGRHLWAMAYLLHAHFGRDGPRRSRRPARAPFRRRRPTAHPRRVQREDPGLALVLHVHDLHRPGRQVPARLARRVRLRSAGPHLPVHAARGGLPHVDRRARASGRIVRRTCEIMRETGTDDVRRHGAIDLPDAAEVRQLPLQRVDGPVRRRGLHQRRQQLLDGAQGPLPRARDRRRPRPCRRRLSRREVERLRLRGRSGTGPHGAEREAARRLLRRVRPHRRGLETRSSASTASTSSSSCRIAPSTAPSAPSRTCASRPTASPSTRRRGKPGAAAGCPTRATTPSSPR